MPWFLKIYDPLVLGFLATAVWRSPASRLEEHYDQHLRKRHLDIGGNRLFPRARTVASRCQSHLDRPQPQRPHPRLPAVGASRRVSYRADVHKPLVDLVDNRRLASVALNLVLHCLPGPLSRKATAITHLAALLEPDGVLFGATVLGTPEVNTPVSRPLLVAYNRMGAFDNLADSEQGRREILSESFATIDLDIVGSVAIFAATRPRLLPA